MWGQIFWTNALLHSFKSSLVKNEVELMKTREQMISWLPCLLKWEKADWSFLWFPFLLVYLQYSWKSCFWTISHLLDWMHTLPCKKGKFSPLNLGRQVKASDIVEHSCSKQYPSTSRSSWDVEDELPTNVVPFTLYSKCEANQIQLQTREM